MAKDFPDGYRSNVASTKQDLGMALSHPTTVWDTRRLAAGANGAIQLINRDCNHVYVVNAVCALSYDYIAAVFFAYHNTRFIAGGNMKTVSYIPIDYSQNINLLYGDYVEVAIQNYASTSQWFAAYIVTTVYPKPDTLVRRPQAYFLLSDYSVAHGVAVVTENECAFDPDSYSWDWGDGSALSTTEEPTHVYAAAGNYYISLTVAKGALTDTYTTIVTIT